MFAASGGGIAWIPKHSQRPFNLHRRIVMEVGQFTTTRWMDRSRSGILEGFAGRCLGERSGTAGGTLDLGSYDRQGQGIVVPEQPLALTSLKGNFSQLHAVTQSHTVMKRSRRK